MYINVYIVCHTPAVGSLDYLTWIFKQQSMFVKTLANSIVHVTIHIKSAVFKQQSMFAKTLANSIVHVTIHIKSAVF